MASPFHAATTLSSRPGADPPPARGQQGPGPAESGRCRGGRCGGCSTDRPCSNVPAAVTPNSAAAYCRPPGPSTPVSSPGVQSIEEAFRAVAVRVQGRGQAALGGPQLGEASRRTSPGRPGGPARPGAPPQVRVHPGQQRVVVEHLLEVRHHPAAIHGIPGESPGQLVIHAPAGHSLRGPGHHPQRRRVRLAVALSRALRLPQQEFEHHRRRELRRAAETAGGRVVALSQGDDGLVARWREHRLGLARDAHWPGPGPAPGAARPARPAPRRSPGPGW